MILCDTNILIELYKNKPRITQELRLISIGKMAISAVTQAELYYGALNKAELRKIKKHLSLIHNYPIDVSISDKFIELMENYSLSHKLSTEDALIAATALVHDIELYTLNLKDFRFIPKLNLYKPVTY